MTARTVVQINERMLLSLGFNQAHVDAMRHFLHMVGNVQDAPTLPQAVASITGMQVEEAINHVAEFAELRKELEEMRVQFESLSQVAELSKRVNTLQQQLEAAASNNAELAELRKKVRSAEIEAAFPPPLTTWEQPGKIGFRSANTGAFTNLSASELALMSKGIRLNGTNSSTAATGNFIRFSTNMMIQSDATNAILLTKIFFGGVFVDVLAITGTGMTVTGKFGCNGKTEQASVALGAAATDLPTAITLANNIRTALIANGIGS